MPLLWGYVSYYGPTQRSTTGCLRRYDTVQPVGGRGGSWSTLQVDSWTATSPT